jgi:acyl-CoA thioesterase II
VPRYSKPSTLTTSGLVPNNSVQLIGISHIFVPLFRLSVPEELLGTMSKVKPKTLSEQLAVKPTNSDGNEYESLYPPQRMGNPLNIAYGGYALATACKAAYTDVPPGYHLYSMLGHYLGPAYADRPLRAKVRTIRQTRTFATRQVEISQKRDDGQDRVCLIAIADFQVTEPATLLEFSRSPSRVYTHYKDLPPQQKAFQKLLDDGKISQELLRTHTKTFGLMQTHFDQRPCPESVFAQNLFGLAKTLPTTQDDLPVTSRTTADWFRCRETMSTPSEHVTNLTFLIDGAIAFLPLSFSHMWFDDVSACSSLEFALRFFKAGDEVDLGQWHLREMRTNVASAGRAYGESWIWDENGKAVACMSQQSILRPPPGGGKVKEGGKL